MTITTNRRTSRSGRWLALLPLVVALIAAGCNIEPPGPTPIPSPSVQPTESPSPSATFTPSATTPPPPPALAPTLRPMITSTALVTQPPVVEMAQSTPTPGPICFTAQAGDTLGGLIFRAGYPDLAPLPTVRELNGLPPGSNDISVGQEYCIPRPTATPTPEGGEATATARARELALPTRVFTIRQYTVRANDNITSIQLNTGASLRELCELNDPTVLNCAGCALDKPIGEQGCRPLVREGQALNVPGPAPTATITPTLTGSETPTPTPVFALPRLVSPVNSSTESGQVQLVWLPVGILEPGQFYLVMWTDLTTGQTWQGHTTASSYRLPQEQIPTDGQPHIVNWQVGVAQDGPDGYILLSPMSLIYTFTWVGGGN